MTLLLMTWQTATGQVMRQADLPQTMSVPKATVGRGNRGHVAISSLARLKTGNSHQIQRRSPGLPNYQLPLSSRACGNFADAQRVSAFLLIDCQGKLP